MNPFKYRPPLEHHDEEYLDWEDTAMSNAMAWFSDKFLPRWCGGEHWTNKISDYLWAECSCCLFWRGTYSGLAVGVVVGLVLGAAL